jgi:hypothetical protein
VRPHHQLMHHGGKPFLSVDGTFGADDLSAPYMPMANARRGAKLGSARRMTPCVSPPRGAVTIAQQKTGSSIRSMGSGASML